MSSNRPHRDHSQRSSAQRGDPYLAVTQSFEGLNLGETAPSYSSREYVPYTSAYDIPLGASTSFGPDVTPGFPDMSSGFYIQSSHPPDYPGGPTHGFTYPTAEVPLSRGVSGHSSHLLPPSVLPSSFEEFADVERDISRQRRRRHARVRREHKTRTRRAVMLSPGEGDDHGSSLAGELSSSIDSLTAQHPSVGGGTDYNFGASGPDRSQYVGTSGPYSYQGSQYAPSRTTYPEEYSGNTYRTPQTSEISHGPVVVSEPRKPQCWDHGCNGRSFSTFSNLLRHQREKSGNSSKSLCPRCGAEFTRKTARDGHMAHDKCKGGRKQSHT